MENISLEIDEYSKKYEKDYKKLENDNKVIDDFFNQEILRNGDINRFEKELERLREEERQNTDKLYEEYQIDLSEVNQNFENVMLKNGVEIKEIGDGKYLKQYLKNGIEIAKLDNKNMINFVEEYNDNGNIITINQRLLSLQTDRTVAKYIKTCEERVGSQKELDNLNKKIKNMQDFNNAMINEYEAFILIEKLKASYQSTCRAKYIEYATKNADKTIQYKQSINDILREKNICIEPLLNKARILKILNIGRFFEEHEKELNKSKNGPYCKFLNYQGLGVVSSYEVEQIKKTINHFKIFKGVHVVDDPDTEYDDYKDYLIAEVYGKALDDWNDNPAKYTISTISNLIMNNLAFIGAPLSDKMKCANCVKYILEVRKSNYPNVNKRLEEIYYDSDYDDQYEFVGDIKKLNK